MTPDLRIHIDWERLEQGSPEERSCFGLITIQSGEIFLTEGLDGFVGCQRRGPLASGYHLAEWLTWNYWRLIAENRPMRPAPDWFMSHALTGIGEGYAWPDIEIHSDGVFTLLASRPHPTAPALPIRYTFSDSVAVETATFTDALASLTSQVLGKLDADGLHDTRLHRLVDELRAEQTDQGLARFRRLEASLGLDADEDHDALINPMLTEAEQIGFAAMTEVAAEFRGKAHVPGLNELREAAIAWGSARNPSDQFQTDNLPRHNEARIQPWVLGRQHADQLRQARGLNGGKVSNADLTEMFAVPESLLSGHDSGAFAYALDAFDDTGAHAVLRSKWEPGRRFELARLLGDSLIPGDGDRLLPATSTHSFRQKYQRAFAAQLLCPFDHLMEMLDEDLSEESQKDAAEHFGVSELTVRSSLVNQGELDRDVLDPA